MSSLFFLHDNQQIKNLATIVFIKIAVSKSQFAVKFVVSRSHFLIILTFLKVIFATFLNHCLWQPLARDTK